MLTLNVQYHEYESLKARGTVVVDGMPTKIAVLRIDEANRTNQTWYIRAAAFGSEDAQSSGAWTQTKDVQYVRIPMFRYRFSHVNACRGLLQLGATAALCPPKPADKLTRLQLVCSGGHIREGEEVGYECWLGIAWRCTS